MNTVRVLLVASFSAMVLTASASFDLALVTDSGTNSVHRIDPMNNVYLGSFGGGTLVNPRGIVVNQNLGIAQVLDATSRISTWNYNTGAFISSFNSNVAGAKFLTANADGTLNVTGTLIARRMTTAGTTLTTYNRQGTFDTQQGILLQDGRFYLSTRTGSSRSLEWFNYSTGAFVGSSTWYADRLVPIGNVGGANTFNFISNGSSVSIEFTHMLNGPQTITGGVGSTLLDTAAGAAPGHGNLMFVVGRDTSTPTRGGILKVDMNSSVAGPSLAGTNYIVTPTGMATVVAPEPGTMLALGGGLALLLRRRKPVLRS